MGWLPTACFTLVHGLDNGFRLCILYFYAFFTLIIWIFMQIWLNLPR